MSSMNAAAVASVTPDRAPPASPAPSCLSVWRERCHQRRDAMRRRARRATHLTRIQLRYKVRRDNSRQRHGGCSCVLCCVARTGTRRARLLGSLRGRAVRRRPRAARTRLNGAWRRGAALACVPPGAPRPLAAQSPAASGPALQLQRAAGAAKGAAPRGCSRAAPRRGARRWQRRGARRVGRHAGDHAGHAAVRRAQQRHAARAARPGGGTAALTAATCAVP